jgi:hypothetical protein
MSFIPRYVVPHYTAPAVSNSHLILCYRNFQSKSSTYSHVGLGVNAINTGKVLRANQVRCDVFPVWTVTDIANVITSNPTVTHLVIEAPFVGNGEITGLVNKYTNIHFACRCHSQLAFLQCEAGAIQLIRDYITLQGSSLNFDLAVNSDRFGHFVEQVYGPRALYLPNLYYLDPVQMRVWSPPGQNLNIGSFGAIRLLKNHITAAGAALMIASTHKSQLKFYLSISREENGRGVLNAIRNLFANVPFAQLIEVPWTNWPNFKQIIGNLDLHMQLSMTETFNITCADAVASGVPTVASEALDWVPQRWVADIDNVANVARVGWQLLTDPHAPQDGLASLQQFNTQSLTKWIGWLNGNPVSMPSYHLS